MIDKNIKQSFWEHLDVLRGTLIKIIIAIFICGIFAFCFKESLFNVILAPKNTDFVTYNILRKICSLLGTNFSEFSVNIINTSLAQQFIVHMKMSFFAGIICVSPYILYQIISFISPALYSEEKNIVYKIVGFGYLMFIIGFLLNYFVIFPLTFRFLGTYQVSGDVNNMISLESYICTMMGMGMMMGIVFELPIICWILSKIGLINGAFLRRYRKHVIVIILTIAAIITPTSDVFTLFLVSLPMWLLFELSINLVKHNE